jgi:transglutaminase-like putative cysteine protease
MRYLIRYQSRVSFTQGAVREHHCELRIAPRDDVYQRVSRATIKIEPLAQVFSWRDSFGNQVHNFCLLPPHEYYTAHLEAEVTTLTQSPNDLEVIPPDKEQKWIGHAVHAQPRLMSFLVHRSPAIPDLALIAREHGLRPPALDKGQPVLEGTQAVMGWIRENFTYTPEGRQGPGPLQPLLKERRGNCHDLAQLLIAVLRGWGVPARYVSGYRPEPAGEGPHAIPWAWAEVLIPGAGWRGFDVAANTTISAEYIAVAVGRDHCDAEPFRGVFKGAPDGKDRPDIRVQMIAQQ